MSVSSSHLIDVSFAGSTVRVAGITIEDFMDDANPVEFQDVEVSSVGVNCNGVIIRNAKQIDDEIKGEPGYPGFAELVLSYIRDEENAEEGSMNGYSDSEKSDDLESERKDNPFDKYRTRYQDGGGLLKDNDISSVINDND